MQQVDCPHCERISHNQLGNEFCSQCGVHLYQEANVVEDKQSCALMQSDNISIKEEPFVVLRPKKKWHYETIGFVCFLTILMIVFVIIPVLTSGDYSSVLPASDKRIVRKIIIFYGSLAWCFYLPFWTPMFRKGICCFYRDRMEVYPFFGRKRMTFKYDETQVTRYGNYCLCVHPYPLPGYSTILRRYKAKYLDGVTFGLVPYALENPGCIDTALQILKERVVEYSEKPLGKRLL